MIVTTPVNVIGAPVTNTVSNHAEKPEQFNGQNFKRWQQKMFFYLRTLNLVWFLNETAPQEREKQMINHLLSEEIKEFLGNPTRSVRSFFFDRIDDEVVQDQRQRDDNDLQDKRQDQLKEEEFEPRKSKRARTRNHCLKDHKDGNSEFDDTRNLVISRFLAYPFVVFSSGSQNKLDFVQICEPWESLYVSSQCFENMFPVFDRFLEDYLKADLLEKTQGFEYLSLCGDAITYVLENSLKSSDACRNNNNVGDQTRHRCTKTSLQCAARFLSVSHAEAKVKFQILDTTSRVFSSLVRVVESFHSEEDIIPFIEVISTPLLQWLLDRELHHEDTISELQRHLQAYNSTLMPNVEQVSRLNWTSFGGGEKKQDDTPVFDKDLAANVTHYTLQETFSAQYTSVKSAKGLLFYSHNYFLDSWKFLADCMMSSNHDHSRLGCLLKVLLSAAKVFVNVSSYNSVSAARRVCTAMYISSMINTVNTARHFSSISTVGLDLSHIVEDFVKRLKSTLGEEGDHYMELTEFEIQEMVNILVSGEAY
uniref:Polyadenylate-binding protein RBP45 n=1 Tax=Tanacetum cinerariifolium TaxID=118510 RepID=A0A6L2JJF2_TANCI|nr:polyadenylate-binding protein RBP45 [Tanacetum cinerariifolium]